MNSPADGKNAGRLLARRRNRRASLAKASVRMGNAEGELAVGVIGGMIFPP